MRTPILDSTAPVAPYIAGENPYLLRSESSEAGRSILDIATPASDSYIKVLNTGVAVLQTPAQLATTLGIDLIGTFSTIRLSGVANPSLAFYLSGNTAVSLPTSGTLATVAQLGDLQPLDVELTALAGLTSAADKLPYFTGSGTASLATFTAAGRTLVGLATSSALVTLAGTSPSIVGTNLLQVGAPLSTPSYMKVRHNLDNEVSYLTPAQVLADIGGQPLDADLTSWAAITRTSFFDIFAANPTSANLRSVVSDETGIGNLVFSNLPTLTSPILTSVPLLTLRDASAAFDVTFAASSGTALTQARTLTFNLQNFDRTIKLLGNPTLGDWFDQDVSSGSEPGLTGTNFTGVPISTAVSGLGANIATFLATPTSANLAAAVTDETGNGLLVFSIAAALRNAMLYSGIVLPKLAVDTGLRKLYASDGTTEIIDWSNASLLSFFAGAAAIGSDNLHVGNGGTTYSNAIGLHAGTNQNIALKPPIFLGTGTTIQSVNDADSANLPLELRASQVVVSVGSVRFATLGAGTLTTDASGNVTASSDATLKDIDGTFNRGMADLRGLRPVIGHWRKESGLDTTEQYVWLNAQDLLPRIPEAVFLAPAGNYTELDRPVLAAVINALNEIDARLAKFEGSNGPSKDNTDRKKTASDRDAALKVRLEQRKAAGIVMGK